MIGRGVDVIGGGKDVMEGAEDVIGGEIRGKRCHPVGSNMNNENI